MTLLHRKNKAAAGSALPFLCQVCWLSIVPGGCDASCGALRFFQSWRPFPQLSRMMDATIIQTVLATAIAKRRMLKKPLSRRLPATGKRWSRRCPTCSTSPLW